MKRKTKRRKVKTKITMKDVIKANRKGSREAENELEGGFVKKHRVHPSVKSYTRRKKHLNKEEDE